MGKCSHPSSFFLFCSFFDDAGGVALSYTLAEQGSGFWGYDKYPGSCYWWKEPWFFMVEGF